MKSGKANVQVVRKDGGSGGGGGALDAALLALAGVLAGRLILARR